MEFELFSVDASERLPSAESYAPVGRREDAIKLIPDIVGKQTDMWLTVYGAWLGVENTIPAKVDRETILDEIFAAAPCDEVQADE